MEPRTKSASAAPPGSMLQQGRSERGLSIEEVAHSLRLSPRIIAALEEDAYDRLPGATYVRGYLRSYAQFLGLNPQTLIDAYNARPESECRVDLTAPAPVRQVTSSDILVRLGSIAVVAVVLGLAAFWWSGHDASFTRFDRSSNSTAEATTPPEQQARAEQPPPASDTPPEPPPVATPPPEQTAAVSPSAPITPPESAPAETAPDPDVPLARLVLHVHEDSWADVRDTQQRRLLYETIPAGRVVTVEGVAPLSVFLGNVEGVTVEFNGKAYDAMRHKRGQVARFTLGARS